MHKNIDFSRYSSVKIGPKCDVLVLEEKLKIPSDVRIIGGANNLLISQNPAKLAVLSDKFDFITMQDGFIKIGAATKSGKIYNFAKKHNIANFEFLRSIPGQLGGLLKMNAGLCGSSMSDCLLEVNIDGKIYRKNQISFEYRKADVSGVIYEAKFKLELGFDELRSKELFEKRANQPKGASFGSCFKNPQGNYAGKLLQDVNLKGYKIGNCGFSDAHANFLINYGGGTFNEAISLIELAKRRVYEEFGIKLECEVVIL